MVWNLICGIIISIITAVLTVHLSLKRFYSEKRWERKFKVYEDIMTDLHHIRDDANHQLMSLEKNIEIPEDISIELKNKMLAATAELRKHIDIGSFVISEEAVSALHIFEYELNKSAEIEISTPKDFVRHYKLKLEAIDKCLEEMRIITKKDLS